MSEPDWKAPPRIEDPHATTRACLRWRICAACGEPSATGHHVVFQGQGGDDVEANIIPLCGSGTTGCHGLIHEEDWETRAKIGAWIIGVRRDTIAYVRGKLGYVQGDDYLCRRYVIDQRLLDVIPL